MSLKFKIIVWSLQVQSAYLCGFVSSYRYYVTDCIHYGYQDPEMFPYQLSQIIYNVDPWILKSQCPSHQRYSYHHTRRCQTLAQPSISLVYKVSNVTLNFSVLHASVFCTVWFAILLLFGLTRNNKHVFFCRNRKPLS